MTEACHVQMLIIVSQGSQYTHGMVWYGMGDLREALWEKLLFTRENFS